MFKKLTQCLKKRKTLFISIIGWCFLIALWYNMMFSHKGLLNTMNAIRNISLLAIFLFVIYFICSNFNIDELLIQSEFNYHYIRYKVKAWTWVEITYDNNDDIVTIVNRNMIICQQHKEQNLSTSKKLSYSAILIRDGYLNEAIGYLRQMLYDPYLGQLARKIVDSELDLIFTDFKF